MFTSTNLILDFLTRKKLKNKNYDFIAFQCVGLGQSRAQ